MHFLKHHRAVAGACCSSPGGSVFFSLTMPILTERPYHMLPVVRKYFLNVQKTASTATSRYFLIDQPSRRTGSNIRASDGTLRFPSVINDLRGKLGVTRRDGRNGPRKMRMKTRRDEASAFGATSLSCLPVDFPKG